MDQNREDNFQEISRSFLEKVHFEDMSNLDEINWNHKHVMRYDYHKLGASVDLGCSQAAKLFEVASRHSYFNASYYWLLFANNSLQEAACSLSEQNLNIDAKVTLVVDRNVDPIYDVYDVFSPSISKGAALNTTLMGTWNREGTSSVILLNSTRIALISTLVFSILVSQFYSSYIVGYLLIVPPKTMKTLNDLLDSNLKVIVENQGYNVYYLNTTKDPVAIELYRKKILNGEDNFMNVTEGIARVQRGGYAFQCDTAYAYPIMKQKFTDKEICDLQEILLNPLRPVHIPLQKGSPFKEMFRVTLRKVVETANVGYQQKNFFSDKPKCDRNDLETVAVDLDHLLMLFYILIGGMVVSFAFLILELGYFFGLRGYRQNQVSNEGSIVDFLKRE
ncbi:ionotropic receptor 75a-like [Armigeres subalbatus]|uniref:ionotropic receptor 75a-like n=1 Tax=Armigeres subalbatus TaxID=124917 RepID=UPI002ED0E119